MKIEIEATYICELNEADAEIVRKYAEKYQYDLELAVWYCYQLGKISLYNNSVEKDFLIEKIISVEN